MSETQEPEKRVLYYEPTKRCWVWIERTSCGFRHTDLAKWVATRDAADSEVNRLLALRAAGMEAQS